MRFSIKILLITITLTISLNAQDAYRFFVNNINMPINNYGILAEVNIPPDGTLGRYDGIGFLFSGGFFISGYNGDSLWANGVMTANLVEDYQPGIVGSDPDDPKNIIYVVSADDPAFGQSWQDWIDAVELGADFYDGNGDGIYNPVDLNNNGEWDPGEDKPDILGDLSAWCVYNDGVPTNQRRFSDVEPLGIEIQQTLFAFDNSHPEFANTENTIFIRYRIINKGTVTEKLDSVLFSLHSDFDIGANSLIDLAGSDRTLNGGFAYKDSADHESGFGENPPAIFHHFSQFPHTFIPGETFIDNNGNGVFDMGIDTALDTAYSHLGPDLGIREIPGAKNQDYFSSVIGFKNFGAAYSYISSVDYARNYQLGLNGFGETLDPCTNILFDVFGDVECDDVNPYFWGSGDPVTQEGWIDTVDWDLRTISTTGPFNLSEGEYYDVIAAYTVGRGTDHINSISVARQNVIYARRCYNSNFGQFPVGVKDEEITVNDFKLYQNYPNPFNPATKIKYAIPGSTDYQSVHATLKVYDVLGREVATLINEEKQPGVYEVNFDASNLSSGIYFYKLTAGNNISTKKMLLIK